MYVTLQFHNMNEHFTIQKYTYSHLLPFVVAKPEEGGERSLWCVGVLGATLPLSSPTLLLPWKLFHLGFKSVLVSLSH